MWTNSPGFSVLIRKEECPSVLGIRLSTVQSRLAVRAGKTMDSGIKQLGFTPAPPNYLAVQLQTSDCPSTGLDYPPSELGEAWRVCYSQVTAGGT